MVFKINSPVYSVEIQKKEGENLMYINYLGASSVPSVADSPDVMGRVINELIENPNVSRVVFVQQRNYNYPFEQISMLSEIAQLYNFLVKQDNILSLEKLQLIANVSVAYSELSYSMALLMQDPIACYLDLKRRIAGYRSEIDAGIFGDESSRLINYVRFLERIKGLLDNTKLIKKVADIVDTFSAGDRTIYKNIFRPDILPNFTFTRLVRQLPEDAELIDQYEIKDEDEVAVVTVLKKEGDSRYLYHLRPEEYNLSEEHHMLLSLGRNVLIENEPKTEDFVNPDRVREVFFSVAKGLINELAQSKGINLNYRELRSLAKILVRQTIGFGLLEVLMMDNRLQDIFLNSPMAQNPVFVRHSKYDECVTNIMPSYEDADSWAAKLRLQSGRPFDEANPVLDTELSFGNVRARVAAIQRPLSPSGIAYALRRPRDKPWTFPLFIDNKMLDSFTAGLISFFVDGNRSILVSGNRSSGKTSLLNALMLEIIPTIRVIVIEDTLEIDVNAMRNIGYNIQRMKVRSALLESSKEVEASEGIRTSLRLGDSALIIGEIRSKEAKSLYEAMRVGSLANVVAGTIHGASPYAVFDRVVNDLEVPVTSFKATDLVLVANPIKTADGLHSVKRVVQLTEVRKHWTKDPDKEKGFVDLLRYNVEKDFLEPTEELINGDAEIIKQIAGNVKGWAGNWDAVFDNIILRGKIKQEIVNAARKLEKPELMEARFNVLANDAFHSISDEITREVGLPVSERVLPEFNKWLIQKARRL